MKNKTLLKIKVHLYQYKIFENIRKFKHRIIKVKPTEGNYTPLNDAEHVTIDWPDGMPKPKVGVVKDSCQHPVIPDNADWLRYQRYLEHNDIPYEFFDIFKSDWIEKAFNFDVIVWRTDSDPATQRDAETKIYFIENHLKKLCYPTYREIWSYEDKVRQYYLFKINNIPTVETFITHEKDEAIEFIEKAKFPIVSKIATGSGSLGVELIKDKRAAKKFISKVFAPGRNTCWTYLKQKNYVYFQEYIPDALYDLRVTIVGNIFTGFYRMRPQNDFRASGAGLIVRKEIPEEALLLAKQVKNTFGVTLLGVDMIKSEYHGQYKVIEASIFNTVNTAEKLTINGVPGYYECCNGTFTFRPGKYWEQELALNEVLKSWISNAKP